MKKIFLLSLSLFTAGFLFAQDEEASTGSLIADIMNVAPVTQELDETTVEADTEYVSTLEEQKAKVEELLGKHGDKFKEDVGEVIEKFNKVLAKGIEQDVVVEKRRVGTSVHALSMNLLKAKKNVMMEFNREMTANIRKLPRVLVMDKEKELKEIISEYQEKFDVEHKANQEVIKAFKSTEHLLKQEETTSTEKEDQ